MTKFYLAFIAMIPAMFAGHADAADGNPFMTTGAKTSQPIGHYEFCKINRQECGENGGSTTRVKLTQSRWAELLSINESVNAAIEPVSDEELYGRPDVWVYPTDKGDCEDYVLLKRRELIKAGWPVADLLITVVRQKNGDGHAVLTVRTDRGDLVLDNLETKVLVWNRTAYEFVKRQSEANAGVWISISDDRQVVVGSVH